MNRRVEEFQNERDEIYDKSGKKKQKGWKAQRHLENRKRNYKREDYESDDYESDDIY